MTDKKNGNNKMELVINSSVAEYLTFVAPSLTAKKKQNLLKPLRLQEISSKNVSIKM